MGLSVVASCAIRGRKSLRWAIAVGKCCALVVLAGGCAAVGTRQAEQPRGVRDIIAQVVHWDEIAPPKVPLPLSEIPRVDTSLFTKENRTPSNDRDWIPELKELAS